MLTKKQFDLLYKLYKKEKIDFLKSDESFLIKCGVYSNGQFDFEVLKDILNPYKVDNAVILAAGIAKRCLPLSKYKAKGLFEVRGEVLIERQIEQIIAAGIKEIVLVVGHLKEQFNYLVNKYNVIIIENPDYNIGNNMTSVWIAKKYLKNTYLCGSDNWYSWNVFEEYVYDSYFACKFSKNFVDEFCVTLMNGDYIANIIRGCSDAWFSMGEIYFNNSLSKMFKAVLNSEYVNANISVKEMIIDDFCIRHLDKLQFRMCKRKEDDVYEFDSVEEFVEFDSEFICNNQVKKD